MKACDVFAAAIEAFSDAGFRTRLTAASSTIVDQERVYATLAQAGTLHLVPQCESVNADLSVDEMKDLYKKGMSSSVGPARSFYDQLMSAAPHGTCPLCGQGKVRTLDHYLPQSKFPSLVVTPANLIPACRDCNMAKLSKSPGKVGEQTLHPYFDDFTAERWLRARVVEENPPAVLYEVAKPAGWSGIVGERLNRHMEVFKLVAAFTLYAAEELSQIAAELQDLHRIGGADSVRQEVCRRAEHRERTHRNSWQTAMYYGLTDSEWFFRQGLFQIKPTMAATMAALRLPSGP